MHASPLRTLEEALAGAVYVQESLFKRIDVKPAMMMETDVCIDPGTMSAIHPPASPRRPRMAKTSSPLAMSISSRSGAFDVRPLRKANVTWFGCESIDTPLG